MQTLQEGDASYGVIMDGVGPTPAAAAAAAGAAAAPACQPGAHAPGSAHPVQAGGAGAAVSAAGPRGMPVHALQQHGQQQPLGPGLTVNFMGKFTVDDDDDEEFRLDPLDWLLDDEADVAEEEALLRLVDPSVEALSDLGARVDPPTTAAAAAAAATSRRRTQREAARRAAERIAAEQQQQWLLKQQQ